MDGEWQCVRSRKETDNTKVSTSNTRKQVNVKSNQNHGYQLTILQAVALVAPRIALLVPVGQAVHTVAAKVEL